MRLLALLGVLLLAACGQQETLRPPVTRPSTLPPPVTTAPSPPPVTTGPGPGGGVRCGTERWAVKTLSDGAPVDLAPIASTVAELGAIPRPAGADTAGNQRLDAETHVFTVHATLTLVRREADHDYHLVLQDGAATMIAEVTDPACQGAASSSIYPTLVTARSQMDSILATSGQALALNRSAEDAGPAPFTHLNVPVVVTGVLFFDYPHGQTGRAPNTAELHPVLAIAKG